MQNYDISPSRNSAINAGAVPAKGGVPMPGATPKTGHDCQPGSKVKPPAGFVGSLINGKV